MRRSGFKSKWPKLPASGERRRALPQVEPGAFRMGSPVSAAVVQAPKPVKLRNASLLQLARNEPCMLRIDGVCNGDWSTCVQCHSNLGVHGKGKGTKAHDCLSFSGCSSCHFWLDQDKAPSYEQKHAATMHALARQIARWAYWLHPDSASTSKQVNAASWALGHIARMQASTPEMFDDVVRATLIAVPEGVLQYCNRYCNT